MAVGVFDKTTMTSDGGWQVAFRAGIWTSPDGEAWHRYPDNSAFDDTYLNRVLVRASGESVAVGFASSRNRGVVIRGHDGKFGPLADGPWARAHLRDVTVWNGKYLIVGSVGRAAATWTSKDGWTWTRRTGPKGAGGLTAVTASERGITAVASHWSPDLTAGTLDFTTGTAEFWTSRDGKTWRRGSTLKAASVKAVLDDGAGVIAVGWIAGSGSTQAAAWSSADGKTWSQMDAPMAPGQLTAITSSPRGLVAVGDDGGSPSRALVWISEDGVSWSEAPADPAFEDAALLGVTTTANDTVAVGSSASLDVAGALVLVHPDR